MKKLPILLILLFFSCKKEETITTKTFWQKLISDNGINRVIAAKNESDYFNIAFQNEDYGRVYSFKGDYLTIGNFGYNLTKIKYYKIDNISTNNVVLGLIFE